MPPASGAASRRVDQSPAPGGSGCSRAWIRPIDAAAAADHRRQLAALGPQASRHRHVDRHRLHGNAGAGEVLQVEARLRAREAAVGRRREIEAAGGAAAHPEAGREGIEHRQVDAVEARLDDDSVAIATGEPDPPLLERDRHRRQPPAVALATDLGGFGEAERDVVDLALHRGADQIGGQRRIGGNPERHAAAPLGEQLGLAVAAAIVDPQPRALDEGRAAAEAGELGIAGDRGRRRQDQCRLDDAALDQDRHLARGARVIGAGGDVEPLIAGRRR